MSNTDQFGGNEGSNTTSDPFGWGKIVAWICAGIVIGLLYIALVGF
jgi:hypothetical protein